MRIITRYILREHISPFIFGLSAIIFIFILNVIFRDLGRLLGKGLPVLVILEFFFLNIAWILALAIPMAVLISCLSTFGRLSSDNEITALKANGTNLIDLLIPVLIVACLFTFLMERFNNLILPNFNYRASLLMSDISRKRPTLSLEPHIFFNDIPNYSILVREMDDKTNELKGIVIHDSSDPQKSRTITAEHGTLVFSEPDERMILMLYDGEIHETERKRLESYQRYIFSKQSFSFSLENMSLRRSSEKYRGDREKTSAMMKAEIGEHNRRIRERENEIRKIMSAECMQIFPQSWQTGLDSLKKNIPPPALILNQSPASHVQRLQQQIQAETRIIDSYRRSIRSLQVEIYKKLSIPAACIIFVLIGAPLGIMARHGGMTSWIFSLVLFLIYWSCLIGGEQLADRGYISPWLAMWGANMVVGIFGIYLVIHSIRESTFIQWDQWKLKLISLVKRHDNS